MVAQRHWRFHTETVIFVVLHFFLFVDQMVRPRRAHAADLHENVPLHGVQLFNKNEAEIKKKVMKIIEDVKPAGHRYF
jgi:hypothetical protein